MAKTKAKKEKIKGAVSDEAYVIGLTLPVNTRVKGVEFRNGVGVLDYPGLALASPDWFEMKADTLVQKAGFGLDILVTYFKNEHSAKITKIAASESDKLKQVLLRGKLIAEKYYKVFPGKADSAVSVKKEKKEDLHSEKPEKLSASDLTDSSAKKEKVERENK